MNFFLKAFIWDLVITLLFVLLVPGVLLTLPTKGYAPGEYETTVIATHAAVFFVVYYIAKVIGWGISRSMRKKKAVPAVPAPVAEVTTTVAPVTTTPPSTPTATTTASSSAAKTTPTR